MYKVVNKITGKVYYQFNNKQDAENAIMHLEDMYGMDERHIKVVEVKDEVNKKV